MKYLLTSGGVTNPSISNALLELLGKPFEECRALCIPTAEYGHPACTPESVWRFVSGNSAPMVNLGWKSVGVLELTALPSMDRGRWLPWLEQADVFLVDGGDAMYLAHWMRESGLAELLPTLDSVWVGVSAGSMVMTPEVGMDFVQWEPDSGRTDKGLGAVDFSIFPHLNHPDMPGNTTSDAHAWVAQISGPAYSLDDQSAIRVEGAGTDGVRIDVVSEGEWCDLRK